MHSHTQHLASNYSEFSFNTLLSQREAIFSFVEVRSECNALLKKSMFQTSFTKSMPVNDFKSAQDAIRKSLSTYLRDDWIGAIKSHVETCLSGVKKGWFKLDETNTEVYNMSKLKKFFTAS